MNSSEKIILVQDSMKNLLLEKNRRYGDAALNPITIFEKHINNETKQSTKSILVRMSDKLSRIQNSNELRLNDIADLHGYLTLLIIDKGWENEIEKLID